MNLNQDALLLADENRFQDEKEEILMIVMIVLLMLFSIVVWVAFCVAVKKTIRKFFELKRQRRRQTLIAAAINRANLSNEADRHSVLPIYIATLAQELNVFGAREEELPTYAQALSMSCTPSPNTISATHGARRASATPGSIPPIVLPPTYERSIHHNTMISLSPRAPTTSLSPDSSRSESIFTVSRNV